MMSGPRAALLLVLGLAGLGFALSQAKWPVSSKLVTAAHADPGNGNGNGNQGGGGNNGNGDGNAGGNGNGNAGGNGNGNGNAGGNGNDNGNNGLHRALGHDKSAGDGDAGDGDATPAETYDLAKVVDSVLPDHGERNRGSRRVVANQLVVIEPAPDFAGTAGAFDLGRVGRDPVFGWGLLQTRPRCATTNGGPARDGA